MEGKREWERESSQLSESTKKRVLEIDLFACYVHTFLVMS